MATEINNKTENSIVGTNVTAQTVYINGGTFTRTEPLSSSLPLLAVTFEGREDKMNEMNKLIFNEKQNIVLVSGFSGFGKTEFVKRFVSSYKDEWNILWINSETEKKIRNSFIKIFNIKREDYNEILTKELCQSLKKNTFIIFDNAPNRKDVQKYEVDSKKVHYIITSNTQDWENHISVIILDVLTEKAALDIFRAEMKEKFKEEDKETYKKIAELIGYVPLTLKVVIGYLYKEIRALGKTFELHDYLYRLKKAESDNYAITEKLPENSRENYKKSFYFAVKMTIECIENINEEKSKLALKIINTCAFLFPNKIKYSDFRNIPYYKTQLDKKYILDSDIRRACDLLRNYSLININSEEDSFQIHDLIQKTIIYQQNSSFIDKHNIYLYYSLEILLHDNDTSESHRNFILNPDFAMLNNTLEKFVIDYYKDKIKFLRLCINLIFANSYLYLKQIFNIMGKVVSKDYINNYYLLHIATESNHYNMVQLIINYGADVDLKLEYSNNKTALMMAAYNINLEIMKLLINENCQMNSINNKKNNVLFYLMHGMCDIKNKHKSIEALEILRLLVARGADVTARGLFSTSLLHAAAESLNTNIMSCLIHEYNLDVNGLNFKGETPIFYISDASDTDRKRRLMAAMYLIQAGTALKHKNMFGETAADKARTDEAEYLYEYYTGTNHDQDFIDVEENWRADELLRAVADGDLGAVQSLYDELGEEAVRCVQYCRAPQQAIQHSKYEILEYFLNHGFPVDCKEQNNCTLLHRAAQNFDFEAIKILIGRNADLALTDIYGYTVLFYLITNVTDHGKENQVYDNLRWLVEKGADPKHVDNRKSTLVHTAALASSARLLRCLVQDYGLNINAADVEGTALNTAIICKNIALSEDRWWETVRCLLDLGARIDITNTDGKTPVEVAREQNLPDVANTLELYQTVVNGDLDALQHLFEELGEQATLFPQYFELPHQVVKYKKYKILEFFLDHGVPVDSRGQNNRTILHIAAINTDFEAIKFLISRDADLAAIDNESSSVLNYLIFGAIANYVVEDQACNILKWLVEQGADPNHVDKHKSTLIHTAAYLSRPQLLRCLVEDYSLNINAVNTEGTALHCAILYKNTVCSENHWWKTVRCLLELGAQIHITNNDGKTAVEVARKQNLPDVANMLELYQAVADGDLDALQHLLEELGEQAILFPQYFEVPHQAVKYKNYNILEYLLDHGVPVDSRGQNNRTILHIAALCTDFEAIQILIGRGADPTAIDDDSMSVLFYLCSGQVTNYDKEVQVSNIFKWLIEQGADPKQVDKHKSTLIHTASYLCKPRLLHCLVQVYDLNVNAVNTDGTALHAAVLNKNESDSEDRWWETVRCLLDLGARIDITNTDGKNPVEVARERNLPDVANMLELYQAVADGDLDALQHLFEELGEQATLFPQYFELPHQAVKYKKYKILEFLLDHGVPVDSRGQNNRTILHIAALNTDFEAIKFLISRDADPTAIDNESSSVLNYLICGAIATYDVEDQACNILKWLVEQGADPKHVDKHKSTLIHTATSLSTPQFLRCLVQDYELNINAADINGTALHNAILYKNTVCSENHWWKTVRCLLDLGARIDITNKDGKTPVEVAREQNLTGVADMLATYVPRNNETLHPTSQTSKRK